MKENLSFFDFHYHSGQKFGIKNWNFEDGFPENDLLFSVGIHPNQVAKNLEMPLKLVTEMATSPNCVTIGECGLDGLITVSEDLQKKAFHLQIDLANKLKKPLIIHCVRRFQEIIDAKRLSETPMIIHGFNRKKELADRLFNDGFYLSFGKALLRNVSLQQILKSAPADRFFLETDAADLDIAELYGVAAQCRQISEDELATQMFENIEKITNP